MSKGEFKHQASVDVGSLAKGIVDMFVANQVPIAKALAALMVVQAEIGEGEAAEMTVKNVTYRFSKVEDES